MNKRYLALVLVVVGVIIYFYPQFQQIAADQASQLTGALFAVGGVILWYLPTKSTSGKKGK
jgi:drug/metabolite transporter (DMT)-like permease